jgi:hypothetical protein
MGRLTLQPEHALGVIQERLAGAVEEGLFAVAYR